VKRIVVGVTGASGVVYGIRLLEALSAAQGIETHLVLTQSARQILKLETNLSSDHVESLAHRSYDPNDLAASIASGSFLTEGMIVAPCSMKTLSMIAMSFNENLLVRAADVTLKEKRKLVVVPRETPWHLGHLRAMTAVVEMGGMILPPIPAFYHMPRTIEDIVDQTVGKILDQFGIPHSLFRRWGQE
jgi:flavin prenyltransferase